MSYKIICEPYILFETIETLYKFVNQISFKAVLGRRRNVTNPEEDGVAAKILEQLQMAADRVCSGLNPNDPGLQKFFTAVNTGRKSEALCLARCMTISFTSLGYTGLEESIREICETWHGLQEKGAWIKGCLHRSLIMSFEEGNPGDLIEQICRLELPAEFQLSLYRALRNFDQTMAELLELIRPVADKLAEELENLKPIMNRARDYWQNTSVEPLEFLRGVFGASATDGAGDHTDIIITAMDNKWIFYDMEKSALNTSGRNFIMFGCGVTADSFLENEETLMDSASATLKILSDRRRLGVLRRLGKNPSYCHELAEQMGADPGNMSRTLMLLHDYGFLKQHREAQRNYYQTDRAAVHAFFQQVEELLFR